MRYHLNGEARYDTNKLISSYVGHFEDFILTALSFRIIIQDL